MTGGALQLRLRLLELLLGSIKIALELGDQVLVLGLGGLKLVGESNLLLQPVAQRG